MHCTYAHVAETHHLNSTTHPILCLSTLYEYTHAVSHNVKLLKVVQ